MLQLTGWGFTENGTMSKTQIPIQLPYEDTRQCISKAQPMARQYITPDKFCYILDEGKNHSLTVLLVFTSISKPLIVY